MGTDTEQASTIQQLHKLNLVPDAAQCILPSDQCCSSKNTANTLENSQTVIDQYTSPSTTSPTIPHK